MVIISVLFQGKTLAPLARALHLSTEKPLNPENPDYVTDKDDDDDDDETEENTPRLSFRTLFKKLYIQLRGNKKEDKETNQEKEE